MLDSTRKLLAGLVAEETLPDQFMALTERWYAPLARWLAARYQASPGGALLVGVHGAQGSGKTTLCQVLELLLAELNLSAVTLSLDDFYLTHPERMALAEAVHPLLQTRGVPGTHDLGMLNTTLDALLAGDGAVVPRFDKSADDRLPRHDWWQLPTAEIVLLEGWCVGCAAQTEAELRYPVNALEEIEDANGVWRNYVNGQLAQDYAALFARLDELVMLQAPSLRAVLEWRSLQEKKLVDVSGQQQAGTAVMNDAALRRFLQHYERITRHSLATLPPRVDYLLRLDEQHCIASAEHKHRI